MRFLWVPSRGRGQAGAGKGSRRFGSYLGLGITDRESANSSYPISEQSDPLRSIKHPNYTGTVGAVVTWARWITAASALLNGHAALSPEMALRFEKAYKVDMEMMLKMQAAYDAAQMRRQADALDVSRFVPA